MASITLDSKEWLKHLGQFDSAINDLSLRIVEMGHQLAYSVGYQTHFFTVTESYEGAVTKGGTIIISDLDKVCIFLRKCSGDVTFKQISNGKTLYITNNELKMQLPVTDCTSIKLVPTYENLVSASIENMWESFGQGNYPIHGTADLSEMLKLSSLKKLLNTGADYSVKANAESGEISIQAGKQHDVRLFATTNLTDTQGPAYSVTSHYGAWLLPSLGSLEPRESKIHFGPSTALIIEQQRAGAYRLLIVIDQEE